MGPRGVGGTGVRAPGIGGRWGPRGPGDQKQVSSMLLPLTSLASGWSLWLAVDFRRGLIRGHAHCLPSSLPPLELNLCVSKVTNERGYSWATTTLSHAAVTRRDSLAGREHLPKVAKGKGYQVQPRLDLRGIDRLQDLLNILQIGEVV